jgi:hypothetical protein
MRPRQPVPANAPITESTFCQKCLQSGHWTADCKNPPAYKSRPSRTALLSNPKLSLPEKQNTIEDEDKALKLLETERRKVLDEVLGGADCSIDANEPNLSESDFSE